jgi:hypothetical protein
MRSVAVLHDASETNSETAEKRIAQQTRRITGSCMKHLKFHTNIAKKMRCCTDGTEAPSEAFPQLQYQNHYHQVIYMQKTHSCNADTSEPRKRIQKATIPTVHRSTAANSLNRPDATAENETNKQRGGVRDETNRRSGGVLARPANLLTSREAMSPWSALFFLVMKFWFGRRGGGIEWVCVGGGERRREEGSARRGSCTRRPRSKVGLPTIGGRC